MNVLLTLDYELFNGKNAGTVDGCLIKPMEELLNILNKYNYKATLFVDTVFINRLKELCENNDYLRDEYEKIVYQLKMLHSQGHDLQLHIHPNWLHANFINGHWQSVLTDYKLSDMKDSEVDQMFENGIRFLSDIVGSPHDIIAYRAGAYSIQTYSDYPDLFRRYRIRVDSSVFRHKKSITSKWQCYDYSIIPKEYVYAFSRDICEKDEGGDLLEVSIPTYRVSKLALLKYKNTIKRREQSVLTKWGDGLSSINALDGKLIQFFRSLKSKLMTSRVAASIDATNGYFLEEIYKKEIKKGGDYMLIMGHPKNFTPYSLDCLDKLLKVLYKSQHSFITISQIQ